VNGHPIPHLLDELRGHLRHRLHADFDQLHCLLDQLEAEIDAELSGCTCHRGRPAHITVTTSQEGTTMGSYNIGTDVDLTAVVKNDQGVNIADNVTWTATEGAVTAGANGTDETGAVVMTAVLSGITAAGDVAVTATTDNGLPFTDTVSFTDPAASVPASIVVTDSAAPVPTA
jgi:hypothetical protein